LAWKASPETKKLFLVYCKTYPYSKLRRIVLGGEECISLTTTEYGKPYEFTVALGRVPALAEMSLQEVMRQALRHRSLADPSMNHT
jgi:hypothetical protein